MPPGSASATTDDLQASGDQRRQRGLDMELPWTYNYPQLEAVTGPNDALSLGQVQLGAGASSSRSSGSTSRT